MVTTRFAPIYVGLAALALTPVLAAAQDPRADAVTQMLIERAMIIAEPMKNVTIVPVSRIKVDTLDDGQVVVYAMPTAEAKIEPGKLVIFRKAKEAKRAGKDKPIP